MDKYNACELAYKNGYSLGRKEATKDNVSKMRAFFDSNVKDSIIYSEEEKIILIEFINEMAGQFSIEIKE